MPKGVFVRTPEIIAKLGIYKRTPETIAKLKASLKIAMADIKIWNTGLTKETDARLARHSQRMSEWHPTEEQRRKLRDSLRDSPKMQLHIKQLNESRFGRVAWNKGLTKELDGRIKGNGQTGRHQTEETKRKLAELRIGKHPSLETRQKMSLAQKGRVNWNKGLTKETDIRLARMAEKKKGKPLFTHTWSDGKNKNNDARLAHISKLKSEGNIGEKNPNWKGGASFHPYSPSFNKVAKLRIRDRDGYTCQYPCCGLVESGKSHDVHHIDYKKDNNTDGNLITLCHRHNDMVNGNRGYWSGYFMRLLTEKFVSQPLSV